ncbi:MAG: DNA recombination protein RmuC [Gammaproteobacteria bacterium]|nr:MAG: DNA recombination protein RmuC [Gammaproteobacteria bacterium]
MNDFLNTLLRDPALPLAIILVFMFLVFWIVSVVILVRRSRLAVERVAADAMQHANRARELEHDLYTVSEKSRQEQLQYQQLVLQHELLQSRFNDAQTLCENSSQQLNRERERNEVQQQSLAQISAKLSAAEANMDNLTTQLKLQSEQVDAVQAVEAGLRDNNTDLQTQLAELNSQLREREASFKREFEHFEQQKQELSAHFKVLAQEVLAHSSKSLQESSSQNLSALLGPFAESINSFKKEVRDIHHRESAQQGELKRELDALKSLNQQISTEAHELATALRGQKKLQGNWGELVLENILERSGLQLGKDYQREFSIATENGRKRPDAVVFLPQNKHLVIDAKVSLNAYTRYVNAEDDGERALALKQHVSAMAERIKELSQREYFAVPEFNSPDMVFMFVPIESAFVEALKADETLFQRAVESQVLVATPTTLLTSLNIVRQLWRYEDQNKHTAALAQKAEAVFRKLNSFLESFGNMKKHLDKASESYRKAEAQLVSGRGNLVKQVGEFKKLAPSIRAELPEYYTKKADLEIDLKGKAKKVFVDE